MNPGAKIPYLHDSRDANFYLWGLTAGQVSSFYCKIVSMSYSSITGSALDLLLLLELEFDDDDDDVDDVPDFEISISF